MQKPQHIHKSLNTNAKATSKYWPAIIDSVLLWSAQVKVESCCPFQKVYYRLQRRPILWIKTAFCRLYGKNIKYLYDGDKPGTSVGNVSKMAYCFIGSGIHRRQPSILYEYK